MPNTGRPARLVLIRHGETVGNRLNLWTGWTDTPLSKTGWDQVRRTAQRLENNPLNAVALYTSPIGRAQGTADIIGRALNLSPISDDALKEMHFGDMEAIDGDSFADEYPELYARWRDRLDESFAWPGGEARHEFRARTAGALKRLAAEHWGQTILLVTHSGFIRMALAHLDPERFREWWLVRLDNCGLTHLVMDSDGTTEVPIFNDVAYLDGKSRRTGDAEMAALQIRG